MTKNWQRIGRLSRTKGIEFERETAIALRVVFPDARRHLENHELDATGVDLMGTGPYRVQCKRGRKYASLTAISEVQCDETMGDVPVLVTRGDDLRALVAVPLEEFIDLLKFKYGLKQKP